MRIKKTTGVSRDSARLMETHETQGDSLVLMKLMILVKTHRHS